MKLRKNIVSAHLEKQHMNLVNPVNVYISLFITGGLINARKRNFNLHHRNTEDQLFPHNSLSAIIVSTLDAGPSCSTDNQTYYYQRINDSCCDKQQPRGPWSSSPDVGGTLRGLPTRVWRSNSVAGPGEVAKGLLPVWGSDWATVRVSELCSWVPSESGVRRPSSCTAEWRSQVPQPAGVGPSIFRVQLLNRHPAGGPRGHGTGVGGASRAEPTELVHPGVGPRPSPGSPYA